MEETMTTMDPTNPDLPLNLLFKLAYYPDRHLTTPTQLVTDFEPVPYLVDSMFKTMVLSQGIGLAANQCKLNMRMFVMRTEKVRRAFINPEICAGDGKKVEGDETCLSFPGIVTKVARFPSVVVKAYDTSGRETYTPLEGLEAICAQHEMDHLNGVTFLDHRGRLTRMIAERTVKKVLKDPRCLSQRKRL